jgi:hypothetical protein
MPEFCPKCHTQAYDDTSFFCYRCGAPLRDTIPKKITEGPQKIRTKVPEKKPRNEAGKFPVLPKASSIHSIKPIEICAQCGGPVADKNRIFCKNCGANIREILSGEGSLNIKHTVSNPLVKLPGFHRNPKIGAIKEFEPALESISSLGSGISSNPKTNERRSIFILAGIAFLFFILMLFFLLM